MDEQKTIEAISASRSLVQSVDERVQMLTKTNMKSEVEKLKQLEATTIEQQADILGSKVRLEAYKKLERQFFSDLLKKRKLANQ